jgi:hypothetical protein
MRVQNEPTSRWPDASVTKDKKAIHYGGPDGKGSDEGWVVLRVRVDSAANPLVRAIGLQKVMVTAVSATA